ncbi:MAG: AAA family ATPase, partial [Kofleriaceae bacterium]
MIQFPPFILDPVEERLWKGKTQLTLRRKPFAILRYLVANPSRLVTHDELLEHVWGGNAVSESAVRSQLHELRQVLGDGVIDTVIGRGYRFVAKLAAAVEPVTQAAAPLIDSTMVGRAAELAALETALDGALTGRRQICFITGEPGIGKTTLVDRFLTGLEARGVRCVRGHCIEQYGTPEPYLPMIELLGRLRKTDQGEQVIATLVRHAPSFAAQLPHLMTDAQFADVSRRAGPGAETRTMRELVESIEALCADQILVIALEDLQWSDVATIDMLSLLGQRKERAKLLVVATSRRAESQTVTHPLNRVMRTLLTRSGATAIPLDRIDRDAISSFLELRFPKHTFPESFLELLERTTAGTPLFMVSFLGELVDRGMIESRDTGWALALASDEIADYQPSTVRQLIDIQLDRLEAQEQ